MEAAFQAPDTAIWFRRSTEEAPQSLRPAPATNAGFRERRPAFFAKPAGSEWALRIDDEPLELIREDGLGQGWVWRPGFFAGEVTAELVHDGGVEARYILDVSPDPTKLGSSLYREMVDEIRKWSPELLFGSEPATLAAGTRESGGNPHVWLARLRRYGPELVRSLAAIRSRPIRSLKQVRKVVPLIRARRVDAATLALLARDPGFDVDPGNIDPEAVRLNVPEVEQHLDGAANRYVTRLAQAVGARIRSTMREMQGLVQRERESETETSLQIRWPVRRRFLAELSAKLQAELRQPPYCDVRRPEMSAAGLNAVVSHPLYARTHQLGWKTLRTGVGGDPEQERLWVSPTWQVFERWCYLRVVAALKSRLPGAFWSERISLDRYPLAKAECKTDGHRFCVTLQHSFPGGEYWQTGARSISLSRYPDVVVRREGPHGGNFVVLDAKYCSSRTPILQAMQSAHLYHDSLRWNGARCHAALLMVPEISAVPWLGAPEYKSAHSVGVVLAKAPLDELGDQLVTLLSKGADDAS